ncbi:DUF1730 domain-containing protein [Halobacteriovorax sp. GB3]|uniref:epoxyqueuosine reductase n=1 Tax=Halobacteriovorax sp. GB3 TaxID=2719615 RepID=UPI002362D0E5|nr:QueG-associated DUF1730 domain-containing protein [Halobacteriovorax sp. GB3]MDD0853651.1 DUF1730 domain-containing protein [Halobacteriovorax sp. GB3]
MNKNALTSILNIDHLKEYGIADFGVTSDPIPKTLDYYNEWVRAGKHGPLGYLEGDRQQKRQDLRHYFPKFKSAVVFLFSYAEAKKLLNDFYKSEESNGLKIAGYVHGFGGYDYHYEVKDRLLKIKDELLALDASLEVELSLDIQPVLERDLALRSGLGWFGKNSMMINKKEGSFVMIGSLLINKDITEHFETRPLETDHCGQCTRCIDACPTDAIELASRSLITEKCISTYTIELFKDTGPAPIGMEKASGEIYGCDICQDVCPWNKRYFRKLHTVSEKVKKEFHSEMNQSLIERFLKPKLDTLMSSLEESSNRQYQKSLRGTPIDRTGRVGMLKNLRFWKKEKGD